jgi:predicted nucleotidyltransferase
VTKIESVLSALASGNVEYIVIGGVAANVHGGARVTFDIDVVYRRTRENCIRLSDALRPYSPYPRGAPEGLPFVWDHQTIHRGTNFTLTTTLGEVDLLGEVTGGGTYEALLPFAEEHDPFGIKCLCVSLPKLIDLKRAAGRPKDYEAIAELEAIWEEREELA